MIGQEALLEKLNNYTLNTLPNSLLFLGEPGAGKHLIANFLADKFNLEQVNINSDISHETLVEYLQCPINKFYLIDLDAFTIKSQNKLLKFIEEPTDTVHLILLASPGTDILDTILNRCQICRLAEYSVEQLKKIKLFDNELIYKICKTPGQLLNADEVSFTGLYKVCEQFIYNLKSQDLNTIVGFETRFNYKEDYDKYDPELFFKLLLYITYRSYLENNDLFALEVYLITAEYLKTSLVGVNKELFMINYLINLKQRVDI